MRIKYLDGLRGVAVLLVLSFHAYTRWSDLVPYGDTYAEFPLFYFGWLGVQLFFLISGFVIFMTLCRTHDLKKFIYKRWLRLFPGMLLASVILYLTLPIFPERPEGVPGIAGLLPGLTFISPAWWEAVLGIDIQPIEGAFWTLYVEFKFYIVSGLIYFLLGKNFLIPSLISLFALSTLVQFLSAVLGSQVFYIAEEICYALSLDYFGWFASGALFYLFFQSKNLKCFALATFMAILSSIAVAIDFNSSEIIAASIVSTIFASSLVVPQLQRLLENKGFLFLGFISYPLYLIHENATIATVIKLSSYAPWLHPFIYPILATSILALAAYIMAKYLEPNLRRAIAFLLEEKLGKLLQKDR